MQILVGQNASIARLAFPDDCRFVLPPRAQMPVNTIVTGVNFATDKPFGLGHFTLQDVIPLLEPMQIAGQLTPKAGWIVFRLRPHLLVLSFCADIGLFGKFGRGWE